MRVAPAGQASSIFEILYDPIVYFLSNRLHLPDFVLFVVGIGVLLAAFNIFDRALPEINPQSSRFSRIAELVYRPIFMVLLGAGITSMTMSVSVSLTLLVPLTAKGYVRRENIIPYIMGANITTFIDTLLAALLIPSQVGQPSAFVIVLTEMLSVTFISLLVVGLGYSAYQRALDHVMEWVLRDHLTLAIFVGVIFVVPVVLLLV
jgi:sodium-dependent phosphate cotransporter